MHERNALFECGFLVLRRGPERPLEIVEDRQQLLHEPLVRERDVLGAVARGTLLVVVEVGRHAQQPVLEFCNSGVRHVRCLTPMLDFGLHYEVFASSSTTSYSPSSTTSSSGVVAPLPPAACACAVACA